MDKCKCIKNNKYCNVKLNEFELLCRNHYKTFIENYKSINSCIPNHVLVLLHIKYELNRKIILIYKQHLTVDDIKILKYYQNPIDTLKFCQYIKQFVTPINPINLAIEKHFKKLK